MGLFVGGLYLLAFNNPPGNPTTGGGVIGAGSGAPASSIYINSSGNVGIATTDPGTRKLKVDGSFEATTLYGDGSNLTGVGGGAEHAITRGFELSYYTWNAVYVEPGTLYHGATKINMTGRDSLFTTTDAYWLDGSKPASLANIWIYVYVGADGSRKLHEVAPDKSDTSGDTAGKKIYYYYSTGGTYWRWIGAVRTNASGDTIKFYQMGDWIYYDELQNVLTNGSADSYTDVNCSSFVPFTSQIAKIHIWMGTAAGVRGIWLRRDGSADVLNSLQEYAATTGNDTNYSTDINLNNQIFEYYASPGAVLVNIYIRGYYNPRN